MPPPECRRLARTPTVPQGTKRKDGAPDVRHRRRQTGGLQPTSGRKTRGDTQQRAPCAGTLRHSLRGLRNQVETKIMLDWVRVLVALVNRRR